MSSGGPEILRDTVPVAAEQARRGGWWHAYVCPVHHTELCDPGLDEAARHRCPHGCELEGEPYESAALVYRYQAQARRLRVLARRGAGGDAVALRDAVTLATDALELHAQAARGAWHDDAAEWMLRGKLFHQALTEAIWATNVAHGLRTLRESGVGDARFEARVTGFATTTLENVTAARRILVHERAEFASNYTAWLNAAGATAAWLLDGDEGRRPWLEGQFGQHQHVVAATADDGWEWEGATYYHVFVLRAYLLSLRGLAACEVPADVRERLARMLAVLPAIAAPGGRLPALHDSPYTRHVSHEEVLEVVALGGQLVEIDGLEAVRDHARAALGDRDDHLDGTLAGWIPDGPTAVGPLASADRSHVFADTGYAILRGPDPRWRALVDFGPHGGAHGHRDKLALYVESEAAWQPDHGITPYASTLREHYASTHAHPTFAVGGRDQAETAGRLEHLERTAEATTLVVACDDAYAGVRAQRTLHLRAGWLLDVLDLSADEVAPLQLHIRPAVPLDLRAGRNGAWSADWRDPSGDLRTVHRADRDARVTPVTLPGPADDPMRRFLGVDWTVTDRQVRFCTVWQPSWAAADDAVHDVVVHGDAVEVVTAAGTAIVPVPAPSRPESF